MPSDKADNLFQSWYCRLFLPFVSFSLLTFPLDYFRKLSSRQKQQDQKGLQVRDKGLALRISLFIHLWYTTYRLTFCKTILTFMYTWPAVLPEKIWSSIYMNCMDCFFFVLLIPWNILEDSSFLAFLINLQPLLVKWGDGSSGLLQLYKLGNKSYVLWHTNGMYVTCACSRINRKTAISRDERS